MINTRKLKSNKEMWISDRRIVSELMPANFCFVQKGKEEKRKTITKI